MRIYTDEFASRSGRTPIAASRVFARSIDGRVATSAKIRVTAAELTIAARTLSILPEPKYCEISTPAPMDKPIHRV